MRPAIPAALLVAALLAGCTESDTRAPDSIAAGASDYAQLCVACHGPQGRGNGPAAAGMTPPVADLSLMARKNGGSFPWLRAMEQIDGHTMGASESHMPAYDELRGGPTVMFDAGDGTRPTPARLVGILRYLQTLQR